MFTEISREATLTDRAVEQVQNLIVNRSLKPGQKLPSERALGEMLGVSRTVVRELVRLLTARGLVEVRAGSGTYIRELGADLVRAPLDLLLQVNALRIEEIHETRRALELEIAGLAAERAGSREITQLKENLEALKKPTLAPEEFASIDVEFHVLLASATRNPLLIVLVNSLNEVMKQVRLQLVSTLPGMPQRAYFYHSRILTEVRKHDPQGARAVMGAHLADTIKLLRISTQQPGPGRDGRLPPPELQKFSKRKTGK